MIRGLSIKIVVAALLAFSSNSVAAQASVRSNDLVHYGDVVEVDVIGSFEYDWRGTLTPEGFLDGPEALQERVSALCRTESEIAVDIEKGLSSILRAPRVAVRIIDRSNRALAYVDGAVRNPQRFRLRRKIRLNELLVVSGGIADTASGEIGIFRPANLSCESVPAKPDGEFVKARTSGDSQRIAVRIADLLRGDPDANPEILSGDIVTIVEAQPVYVIGAVNSPRQVPVRNQTLVSRAVAAAGGLSREADGGRATIYRLSGTEQKVINVDINRIRDGDAEDVPLSPFDIVEVQYKGRPPRRNPPDIDTNKPRTRLSSLPLRIIE